jgi:hypothetical protein
MKKLASVLLVSVLLNVIISSCESAIEENIGNSTIQMSRISQILIFSDTLKIVGTDTLFNNLKDTTLLSIGVYRSGLSSNYPEVTLNVKIDSLYLKSLIQQANDPSVPDILKTATLLNYKNSVLLPSSCYKITQGVRIESGKMVGNVDLLVNKSRFARLKASKIFLPIAIDTTSVKGLNTKLSISIIQFKNSFVIKKI